jgi:hypothetical protein
MLDIIFLGDIIPVGMKLMQLTRHLPHLLHIKCLIDLTEAALAQQAQQLILLDLDPIADPTLRVDLAVLRVLLFVEQFVLFDVHHLLFVQALEDLLVVGLFAREEVGLGGDRVAPLVGVLLVLFVGLF